MVVEVFQQTSLEHLTVWGASASTVLKKFQLILKLFIQLYVHLVLRRDLVGFPLRFLAGKNFKCWNNIYSLKKSNLLVELYFCIKSVTERKKISTSSGRIDWYDIYKYLII